MNDLTLQEWFEDARENGLLLTTCLARISLTATQMDGIAPPAEPEPIVEKWCTPVGDDVYPPAAWYVSVVHDLTGKANNGYRHTGIDLNVARAPYGDVDRGQPVFAVADATVVACGYSDTYLGSIVIRVDLQEELQVRAWSWKQGAPVERVVQLYEGQPLFVRYWHLADDDLFSTALEDQQVAKGCPLGHLGNYTGGDGGDHLHFDMALAAFPAHAWFTQHPEIWWVDPLPVLAHFLGPAIVDLMVSKELG